MNTKRLFPIAIAACIFAGVAADSPSNSGVVYLNHERVSAMFATGGTLLATNNFKVMALRRDKPGEVEVHDSDTDIFYIVEGTAKFVTGGQVLEAKSIGHGETRGRSINGGEERTLAKGDVLVIPNGVPHWFKDVRGEFLYYVVKVSH